LIPTKEYVEEVGNLPGREEVFATIGDPRMVMKSLTKLYSNTALATIREYSTNARDSNVAAGRADVPIEVSLPTLMSPYFIVKDTGLGLDVEELEEIYISYGTSTKRESNDFNGMLGFGSKSALAFTNTFTVISVKNGLKHAAVVTRKQDYSLSIKVVSTSKTLEENGVTIKVPVSDRDAFNRIAMDFYRFWIPGTVLVDGQEPKQAVGEKIADDLYYSVNDGISYVVMGNVGYRIANPDKLFTKIKPVSFVAYVPNGSVEFTPSREDLEYSNATRKTLDKIVEVFEVKMKEQAIAEINQAGKVSDFDAYSLWCEWSSRIGADLLSDFNISGKPVSKQIKFIKTARHYRIGSRRRNNTEYMNPKYESITISRVNNSGIIIHGMPGSDLTSNHKLKVREYIEHMNISASDAYFFWEDISCPWVHPDRILSWEELKKRVPRKKREVTSTGRPSGSWDYFDDNAMLKQGLPIPASGTLFYAGTGHSHYSINNIISYHKHKKTAGFDQPVAVVVVPGNRLAKFKRDYPHIENLLSWAGQFTIPDGDQILSEQQKTWMQMNSSRFKNYYKYFDSSKIIDPDWKKFSEIVIDSNDKSMVEYELVERYASNANLSFKRYSPTNMDSVFEYRYPLLAKYSSRYYYSDPNVNDEWIAYMNDAYRRKVNPNA
jgi:hypothetical protein